VLVESLVSSLILTLIIVTGVKTFTSSILTTSKAQKIDKTSVEMSMMNDNVRHQVSLWRRESIGGMDSYNVSKDECTNNLAQVLLNEMDIETIAILEPYGHTLGVRYGDKNFTKILLPQSEWCS
jgi:hypothetical protein